MVTDVTICDGVVVGYLTAPEFARKHNIPESTMRVWINRGKIDHFKIGPMTYIDANLIPPAFGKPGRKKQKVQVVEDQTFDLDGNGGACPVCGKFILKRYNPKYCGACGKEIKWED